jgi:hypothetical protein
MVKEYIKILMEYIKVNLNKEKLMEMENIKAKV